MLRRSLTDVRFSHAFQPIVNVETGDVHSYEALIRGPRNEPPDFVFGQVDQGSLLEFDQLSREKALTTAAALNIKTQINLNFSPGGILFERGRYLDATIVKSQELGLRPDQLVIEITEGELVHNYSALKGIVNHYRREQLTFAIDDFGAGYSSLTRLSEMLPDVIKLDRMLIRNIHRNGPRQSISKAVITVCEELGVDVVAEGVETAEEFTYLKAAGIRLFQGLFFSRPGFEVLPLPC